jgi:hypothetical protein
MKVATIYALLEPASKEPCYVGQTVNVRHRRWAYKESYRASNERLREWIRSLQWRSQEPEWLELEQVSQGPEADRAERQWVRLLRETGCDLRNAAAGGRTRVDRRAAQTSRAEWLQIGQQGKLLYEQALQYYCDLRARLPRNARALRRAERACQLIQKLRFDVENIAAEEHPSWNVLGMFAGPSDRSHSFEFSDLAKLPASPSRVDLLRQLVQNGAVHLPMRQFTIARVLRTEKLTPC